MTPQIFKYLLKHIRLQQETPGDQMGHKEKNRTRRIFKKAACAFASALLVSGLMLGSGRAKAQDKPKEKPEIMLKVKMGAAYDYLLKEPRALIAFGSSIPLPLSMRLDASMGVSTPFDGSVKWEELNLNLSIPIKGPVSIDVYGYNSRHLAIQKFSTGGDVCMKLPFGAAMVFFERIMDEGQLPVSGALRIDALRNKLAFFAHGAYVTNKDSGALRGRVYYNLKDNLTFGIDTLAIFNKNEFLFIDSLVSTEWRF